MPSSPPSTAAGGSTSIPAMPAASRASSSSEPPRCASTRPPAGRPPRSHRPCAARTLQSNGPVSISHSPLAIPQSPLAFLIIPGSPPPRYALAHAPPRRRSSCSPPPRSFPAASSAACTSEPPGRLVWVNDVELGRTPVEADFTFYGHYDVRASTATSPSSRMDAPQPFYEYPPFDLVAMAIPADFENVVKWH